MRRMMPDPAVAASGRRAATAWSPEERRSRRWWWALGLLLPLGAASLVGYYRLVYRPNARSEFVNGVAAGLSMRASLQRLAIDRWIVDAESDARLVATYPSATEALVPPSWDRSGLAAREHLSAVFSTLVSVKQFASAELFDRALRRVAGSPGLEPVDASLRNIVAAAVVSGQPSTEIYRDARGSARVLFVAPVVAPGERPQGIAVLTRSSADWLYPLLSQAGSPGYHAYLVRRQGAFVQYLSPLPHDARPPLEIVSPAIPGSLGLAALDGPPGFGEFVEGRGEPVLAAFQRLRQAPWGLVIEVDRAPALADFEADMDSVRLRWGAMYMLAVGLAAALIRGMQRAQQTRLARSQAERAVLLDQANDAIVYIERDGRILDVNRRAEDMYGWSREQLLAMRGEDLRSVGTAAGASGVQDEVLRRGALVYQSENQRADGTTFPVEVSIRVLPADVGTGVLAIIRDISQRHDAMAQINRLNRLLRALVQVDEAICRIREPSGLFAEACRLLAASEAVRLAWVGLADAASGEVRVAAAGGAVDYLRGITVRADDSPLGRGPTGRAIRTGESQVCQDPATDPTLDPWRAAQQAAGLRASAAFPLRRRRAVVGALTVYLDQPHGFGREEVDVFAELAANLSSALDAYAERQERERAEAELRASEARYRLLADHSTDVIWTFDLEALRVTYVSPSVERLRGFTPAEVAAQSIDELIAPSSRSVFRQALAATLEAAAAGGPLPPQRHELDQPCRDGSLVATEIVATLLFDEGGRLTQVLGVSRDITERKRMEIALRDSEARVRAANLELEARVTQRTAALEAANRELEAFSYSVSHDLRAPLRAIDGFANMLTTDHAASLNAEGARLLAVIRESSQRMSQLIDDLLSFSRVGRHELRRLPVALEELVRSVVAELDPSASRARLDLVSLPVVVADPALLRQVLVNLLSNAYKFAAPVSEPHIVVRGSREGSEVSCEVCDNGVGFDMRHVDKLFGVFQRLHASRDFEGTGVGLALVRRIVERHGGRVWARGEVGHGATFGFALPAAEGLCDE